ncbi:thiol-disulfide isomerase/thioredoxin [Modicisalibacter xianhensis]|uniref:Thiol-disulfide isomerase/thioredoxin n=1 Tax=Modicisalibacter xianhensis TaxID=442341 RepID=A0A4V3GUV7_9GAMM|nr:TlpA disulfide reductase family protein [Halomonas xianhensis]TDX31654.1 thiol-disulfide isomerase/thioredoxin [Halomonas xianhensis]
MTPVIIKRSVAIACLMTLAPIAAASPPEGIGPQGFMVWESSRDLPALSFQDGQGRQLTLDDFQGQTVLLNIWATWCGPCRKEMPTLDALQATLGGKAFEVIALSIDRKGIEVVQDFYTGVGIEHLRQYIDTTGMAGTKLGAVGIPTTLLIDPHGDELGRLVGATEWDSPEMTEFLEKTIELSQEESP